MADGGDDLDEETIGGLFSRLIDDGRALVRAEIHLHWASLFDRISEARTVLVLAGIALLLVASSFVGVIVGSVIALSRWIGPFAAGVVVTLVTLLLAAMLFWLAARRLGAASEEPGR